MVASSRSLRTLAIRTEGVHDRMHVRAVWGAVGSSTADCGALAESHLYGISTYGDTDIRFWSKFGAKR